MTIKRGFSLLETLIAAGILIVVVLSIVSLSNSLIAGTVVNADKTIINRWAVEGLELTQKIRDDNIKGKLANTTSGLPIWFNPAINDNGSDYGWYKLSNKVVGTSWQITRALPGQLKLTKAQFTENSETLSSDQTTGYRLICVEAFSAVTSNEADEFRCNTDAAGVALSDGVRTNISSCDVKDLFCSATKQSLNKNKLGSQPDRVIPAGNAVKVRSVIIWQDKDQTRNSSVSTLLTNWKGLEQN